jgi:hypothetical protein
MLQATASGATDHLEQDRQAQASARHDAPHIERARPDPEQRGEGDGEAGVDEGLGVRLIGLQRKIGGEQGPEGGDPQSGRRSSLRRPRHEQRDGVAQAQATPTRKTTAAGSRATSWAAAKAA